MKTTKSSCNLILGVGDGKSEFRSFQYSHSVCNVIGDKNPLPIADWHPAIENAVYYGMDWNCPSYHKRLHELLAKDHGNITAELTIRKIAPGLNSGNLQIAVYDLSYERIYFSYGTRDENNRPINAYERPYLSLDLKKAFSHRLNDS